MGAPEARIGAVTAARHRLRSGCRWLRSAGVWSLPARVRRYVLAVDLLALVVCVPLVHVGGVTTRQLVVLGLLAERTERLVLVGAGGVERSVSPALRVASLPGAHLVLSMLGLPGFRTQTELAMWAFKALDTGLGRDAEDLVRIVDALPDLTSRQAFLRTLRAVVDWRGQVVTMLDRCYLTAGMPTLLLWGADDVIVGVEHARAAHVAMPHSRLEVFERAGHFPFHSDPARFLAVLRDFLATTDPADWSIEQWRALLRAGRDGVGTLER